MVMASGRSSLPILTEAIAGRSLEGSWMADPDVHRIWRVWRGLDRHDLISAPLVLGKEVLLDSSLGPAVERVARDQRRCEAARARLPDLARRLLERVEGEGSVRMDHLSVSTKEGRRARLLLQQELLAVASDIHTEAGYHTAIVRPWSASEIGTRFAKAAAKLTLEGGITRLGAAAVRSAVVVPEREARRWFVFGAPWIDDLVMRGEIERLEAEGRTWLTRPQ